ncbi:MAG: hypothetical protein J1D77_03490 [Muribaculaceae bacterium]|nr:hypothetical protein [Muribaculaceae bacterium]
MIDKNELQKIEEIVNQASPCKWCGKSHSVRLFLNLSESIHPDTEAKIFPSGEMLFSEYDEFTCDKFKANVNSFIDSQAQKLIVPNVV